MKYIFKKPARAVSRVFIHCSASDAPEHDNAATMELWHRQRGWAGIGYHFFIRKSGELEMGRSLEKVPAAQEGHNTGTIAICLHGLAAEKFTEAQFDTLRALCRQINEAYGAKITFHGHCEVSRKACPVFDYRRVLGLTKEGRLMAAGAVGGDVTVLNPVPPAIDRPGVLREGATGPLVRDLQLALEALRYFPGDIDGRFGPRTRDAVMAFQADHDLETDGVFGPATREALANATPRPVAAKRASSTPLTLMKSGSRIATSGILNGLAGAGLSVGGLVATIEQLRGTADVIQGQAREFEGLFTAHGPVAAIVIIAAGAFVAWNGWRAAQARAEDQRVGKTA